MTNVKRQMTNGKCIYFAGSIRGGRDDQALYFEIVKQLRQYGSVLTEHVADENFNDHGESLSDRQIHDRDIAWLKRSDCLIAEVTTPSLGVGYEIAKASEWGKPILCLFRPEQGRSLSAMIAGCRDVSVREYRTTTDIESIIHGFLSDV